MDILITAAWIIGYLAIGAGVAALLLWKVPWSDQDEAGMIVAASFVAWPWALMCACIWAWVAWSGKQVTKILKKESNA